MLSIAIKHAILVTLIILIIHFMIKNYLLEKQANERFNQDPQPLTPLTLQPTSLPSQNSQLPLEQQPLTPPTQKQQTKTTEDELYNFVFQVNNTTNACSPLPKQVPNPEEGTLKASKETIVQPINSTHQFINEYENENALNGGSLNGGLKGFDNSEGAFFAYEPI